MNKWMKKWMKEIMNKKKKDWFVWIVDLILSKKLKGKHEKKDGVAKLWIWIYIEQKRWGWDKVVYLNNKRYTRRKTEKKMGLPELWIWNK